MAFFLGTQCLELLAARFLVSNESVREGVVLNVRQHLFHRFLDLRADHTRTGHVVTVLSCVGARPALLCDAALVNEVDDQLHLVAHLEVGDLGLVASLNEGFEAGLDQVRDATAQHGLLTEQVGFGFFGEGRLDDAGAGGTQALGVCQSQIPCVA